MRHCIANLLGLLLRLLFPATGRHSALGACDALAMAPAAPYGLRPEAGR